MIGQLGAIVARSRPEALAAAILGGLVAGVATSAVLSSIDAAQDGAGSPSGYLAACALVLAARLGSELVLLRGLHGWTATRRTELAARIVTAVPADVERVGPARLVAVATDDVSAAAAGLPIAGLAVVELAVIGACLGHVASRSPWVAAVVLAGGTLGLLALERPRASAEASATRAREARDRLVGTIEALVDGARELKQDPEVRRELVDGWLRPQAAADRDASAKARIGFAAREALAAGLALLAMAAVALAGDAEALVVLVYLLLPARRLVGYAAPIARASVALRRLAEAERDLPTPLPSPLPALEGSGFRELTLRGVTADAPGGFRLGPVDLTVRRGEVVLITGGNGSGKSTLLRVLTGLARPEAGRIEVDGVEIDAGELRSLCSAVFWDHHLFGDLHDRAAPLGELGERMLTRLGLAGRVSLASGRWSTTELSQGQRKRLALVAALAEDRPIVALDEWAAEQDPELRRAFYEEILPELRQRGRCVIAVTHDEPWFGTADRAVGLEAGRIRPATVLQDRLEAARVETDDRVVGPPQSTGDQSRQQ